MKNEIVSNGIVQEKAVARECSEKRLSGKYIFDFFKFLYNDHDWLRSGLGTENLKVYWNLCAKSFLSDFLNWPVANCCTWNIDIAGTAISKNGIWDFSLQT